MDGFKTSVLVLGGPESDFMHTRWAFKDAMVDFGPENFSSLQRSIKDEVKEPSLKVGVCVCCPLSAHHLALVQALGTSSHMCVHGTVGAGVATLWRVGCGPVLQVQARSCGPHLPPNRVGEHQSRHGAGCGWRACKLLRSAGSQGRVL